MPLPDSGVAHIQPPGWRAAVRLWPIALFLSYLGLTVLLFAFGPIPWPVTNPGATYGFVAAAHLALLVGYLTVPFRLPRQQPAPANAWLFSAPKLVVISSLLNIGLLLPATLFMSGSLDIIAALREPGAAYRNAYQMSVNTTNPWTYALLLAAPLLVLVPPLAFYYWRELPLPHRCLAVAAIATQWASGSLLGRYKTTADVVLIGFVFFLAHIFRRSRPPSRRKSAVVLGVALITAVLLVSAFSGIVVNRAPNLDRSYVDVIDANVDFDNPLIRPFPPTTRPAIGLFYRYLTQGYYGLSLALRVDFVWTYGAGNSFFLHEAEERFLGSEYARHNAYPARVEEAFGYGMLQRWHSIYPWIASDLGFFGTILFVALVGMLLAVTWFETLAAVNPFSVSMFANTCLMLFYFNANNQVLGFPLTFSATVGTTAIWLYTRRRLRSSGEVAIAARPSGGTAA